MNSHRLLYPIKIMARVLGVSRSGFYARQVRQPSSRETRHQQLRGKILQVHLSSHKTYGVLRLLSEIRELGLAAGRDQISLLRKEMGLRCVQKKKFVVTTNSAHGLPVAENLLMQNFQTTAPGQVWGADITYVRTAEGWLYLAAVKDFHTREVVGYAMAHRMTEDLVRSALANALASHQPNPGCICHSDQGSQYCSAGYQLDLLRANLRPSMSRRGNCWDNAPTESLWSTLKQELIRDRVYATRAEAQRDIRHYIEAFYNRQRRHSSLGNLAPAIYARNFYKKKEICLT